MRRSSVDMSILLLRLLLLLCYSAATLPNDGLDDDANGCPGNYSLIATEQPLYITDNPDFSTPSHTYANSIECQWSISAANSSQIIQLSFSHFDLECGYDYVSVYDGNSATSGSILAKLCGNRTLMNDTIFSDSSSMTVTIRTDATTVRSGFLGTYQSIDRCHACATIGHGTCNAGGTLCECYSGYMGVACEKVGQNDTLFTPRYFHAAVYYPPRDSMVVYGGTTMNGMPTPELLEFHFSNMSWTEMHVTSPTKPIPRYGHTLFVYNNSIYCFGGSNSIGVVMNDLWKLDPDGWNWTQIQYANRPPPILISPSVTVATLKNESTRIFLFGGYSVQASIAGAKSRDLYAYDIDANVWYAGYRQNSVGIVSAAGIYNAERDSLFYFGGLRSDGSTNVYEYHLPSGLWFIGEQQPTYQGRVQGTYASVWNGSEYLFLGGEMPYQNYSGFQMNECYFGDILLYDTACGTMTVQQNVSLSGSPGQNIVPRKGHSMVIRNDVAWILGGHNGFDLADLVSFSVPKGSLSSKQIAQCKALRWCSNYNDCQDCLQRSQCSYCNNMCLYDTSKAGTAESLEGTCQSLQAAEISSISCPSRQTLNLNDTFESSVRFDDILTFKTFVDAPNSDIIFSISPANESVHIYFQTLNVWQGNINQQINPIIFDEAGNLQREIYSSAGVQYQPINASKLYSDANPLTGTNPTVILRADDWRRFSGYYVYRISPDPKLPETSMFQNTINYAIKNSSEILFKLSVDTIVKDVLSGDSTSDGSPSGDSLKIAAVVLLTVSLVMFGAITLYMLRRMQRYSNARSAEAAVYDMQDFGSLPDLTVSNAAGVYRVKVKTLPLQPKREDIQPEHMAAFTWNRHLQPLSVQKWRNERESTVNEASQSSDDTPSEEEPAFAVHYVLVLPTPPPPPSSSRSSASQQECDITSINSTAPSEENTQTYLPTVALGCTLARVKPDTRNDTTIDAGPSRSK